MYESSGKLAKKPWTVLVYMVADDPQGGELLDQQANRELDRIIYATLGCDDSQVHVAVQLDYRSQRDVWRRVVGHGGWRQPESDASDPETLYGFFQWAKTICPGDRYLLMFWGHSRSLFGLFTDSDPWEYVAQTLTLPELRTALKAATDCIGRELDIVVFKDCYMSTLETACELKGLARYLVASQALVPIEGWPYSEMLAALIANKDNPRKAAEKIVDDLRDHYNDRANRDGFPVVPYALLDTSKADMAAAALTPIVEQFGLGDSRATKRVLKAMATSAPRTPGDSSLLDVRTLCRRLKELVDFKDIAARLDQTVAGSRKADDDQLVVRHYPNGNGGFNFSGVSVFCYPSTVRATKQSLVARLASRKVYESLKFAASGWQEVALRAMPLTSPAEMRRYTSDGIPELVRQLVPVAVLEQLINRGLLEQIQREAFDMAQGTIAGLVKSQGFIEEKSQGFIDDKSQGFSKSQGFTKSQGFIDDKSQGFVASPNGPRAAVNGHRAQRKRPKAAKRIKLRVVHGGLAGGRRRVAPKDKPAAKARRRRPHTYETVVTSA